MDVRLVCCVANQKNVFFFFSFLGSSTSLPFNQLFSGAGGPKVLVCLSVCSNNYTKPPLLHTVHSDAIGKQQTAVVGFAGATAYELPLTVGVLEEEEGNSSARSRGASGAGALVPVDAHFK